MSSTSNGSKTKWVMYLFLLVSLNAVISKIVFLARFNNAHDACIKTYNINPETTKGSCHPKYRFMYCNGRKTASITGKCPDGTVGQEVDGISSFDSLRVSLGCDERDGEKDGEFSCACCTKFQCEHSRKYSIKSDVTFLSYDDEDILKRYPQYDCEPNEYCYAWCSDGVWTNDKKHATTRKALYQASYIFAIIDLIVECVCVAVAFSFAVFGVACCCTEPIQTSPFSFIVLLALSAEDIKDGQLKFTIPGRMVMIFHLIDDLVSIGLVAPLLFTMMQSQVNVWTDQTELSYLFVSSCAEVLLFLVKIRVANKQLGGPSNLLY